MRVVDTHFHWYPRSYLEALCRRTDFPRAEKNGDGYVYWYNDGRSSMSLSGFWYDLDRGLATAESNHPETAVLCTSGVYSGLLDQAPVSEAVEIAISFNEEMATAQRRFPGQFFGTACIPLQDTDKAISVLDHAIKELDLRGVNLPAITGDELIDVERLEPFYARVEELGIPLIVHPTDIVFQDVLKGYEGALHSTIGRLLDSSVTVLRLIFTGVLERYPDLKVMHTHAGGLLPYQAGRIDKNSRQVKLERPPSEYLKQVYVDTVAPQALTIKTAIEFYGIERVVYGTDYPCWSPAEALQVIEDCQLSPSEEATILRTNAEKLLNI